MRRSLLGVAAACAALGVGIAAPGIAHAGAAPTTVTIGFIDRPGDDLFRGRVGSPAPACRENRLVRLFFVQPGPTPDVPIDTDRSEDDGAWDIDIEAPGASSGRYYVRVSATTACERAVSSRVLVP